MTGMYKPTPDIPAVDTLIVTESHTETDITLSTSENKDLSWTIAKKTGYQLIGIRGYSTDNSETGGKNSQFVYYYKIDFAVGELNDTLYVGIRNTSSSNTVKADITLYLVYIKSE